MTKNALILVALTLLMVLSMSPSFAAERTEGICHQKAQSWQQGMHQLLLNDIGIIQGYWEETDYHVITQIHDLDNRTETYTFSVLAGNDELESWVWKYQVTIEVWLAAGGTPSYCDVMSATYLGAFDSQID